MRIGVGLDDVLTKAQQRFELYNRRLEIDADSIFVPKLINDNSFWAGMEPYEDVAEFFAGLGDNELFILTERPQTLFPVTRAWLRKQGLECDSDHIIHNSIKRYDARMLRLDFYIDTSCDALKGFRYEGVQELYLCREPNCKTHNWTKNSESRIIKELKEALGLRYEKMHVPFDWRIEL